MKTEAKKNKTENQIVLYKDENGKTNISVRFSDEDVWVTQKQLAEIYQTTHCNKIPPLGNRAIA